MSYEDREKQTLLALFEWWLADCDRQVEAGFPLLRTVNDIDSRALLKTLGELDSAKPLSYMQARVKAEYARHGLRDRRCASTTEEKDLYQEVKQRSEKILWPEWREWMNAAAHEPNPIKKSKLLSALSSGLKDSFGPATRLKDSPNDLLYNIPVADWYFGVSIYVGRRYPFEVRGYGVLSRWQDEIVHNSVCNIGYIGQWRIAREYEIPDVIEALKGVHLYLLETIPEIVGKISDQTPYPLPNNAKYLTAEYPWSEEEQQGVRNIEQAIADGNLVM